MNIRQTQVKTSHFMNCARSAPFTDQKYCASAKKKTVKTPSMDIPKKAMQNITKATPEKIAAEQPDTVIIAAGAHAKCPPIPGIELAMHALDVYTRAEELGKHIVMVGGGLVGCETGLHLSKTGHTVTVIDPLIRVAHESCGRYRNSLIAEMERWGVEAMPRCKCLEIQATGVVIERQDGSRETLSAESVVYALGMASNDTSDLEQALSVPFHRIGDCAQPAKVAEAITSGFFLAMEII